MSLKIRLHRLSRRGKNASCLIITTVAMLFLLEIGKVPTSPQPHELKVLRNREELVMKIVKETFSLLLRCSGICNISHTQLNVGYADFRRKTYVCSDLSQPEGVSNIIHESKYFLGLLSRVSVYKALLGSAPTLRDGFAIHHGSMHEHTMQWFDCNSEMKAICVML